MTESYEGPFHIWGDNWPYWDDLYMAEEEMRAYVKRYSGCYLSSKEKYGTIRYENVWTPWHIHQWPIFRGLKHRTLFKAFYEIDNRWREWGKFILRQAIKKAVKKRPHIKAELLDDADYMFS